MLPWCFACHFPCLAHVHKPEAGTPSMFDPQWGAGLYLLVAVGWFLFVCLFF